VCTGRLHRAGQLRAAGYTADEVHRMLRSGALTAVRRGAYVEGARPVRCSTRHCAGPGGGRAYPPPAGRSPSPTAAARAWASRAAASRSLSPGCPLPLCSGPSGSGGRRPTRTSGDRGSAPVGEFDGKVKYGRLLEPGQDVGEVVYAEKLREDAIRDEGWQVVRWTWLDLRDFGPTAARIRARFATV
jgi:hypothetical protein